MHAGLPWRTLYGHRCGGAVNQVKTPLDLIAESTATTVKACQFVARRNTKERWCPYSQGNFYLRDPSEGAVPTPLAEWLWHFQRKEDVGKCTEPFSLM